MHNTAFLLLLFCFLLLLLDLVPSLFFAHLKLEPDQHKATVPSFSSSSAFCCCCLKASCPSSLHTSRWSLTDTKQNMSSCCSIYLCGQNTVHESCIKADTCDPSLLFLFLHLFVRRCELLALCIRQKNQQGFPFKQLCLQHICTYTYLHPENLLYTAQNISTT